MYEIDAFNDEILRIHTAVKNPNNTMRVLSWNGSTGNLNAASYTGTWAGDVIAIEKGGTSATTAKGAEYNILKDMATATTAIDDDSTLVVKRTTPSATAGVLVQRPITDLTTYLSKKYLSLSGGTITGTLYCKGGAGTIGLAIGTASKPENVSIISVGDGTEYNRFSFRQYGTNGKRENFNLPNTTTPEANTNYYILTSKNPVTIAQGGTNATDAPTACANLGAVKKSGDTMTGSLNIQTAYAINIGTAAVSTWNRISYSNDGTNNRLIFHQRGQNGKYEYFNLPNTSSPSADTHYKILTTKSAVTIAQGGTGATTAAAARTALGITPENIGALPIAGGTTTGDVYLNSGSGVYGSATGWTSFSFLTTDGKSRGNLMLTNTNCFHFNQKETGATYAERYKLPDIATGLTGDVWYAILTSKNAVTIAQGGTGAKTAAAARTNLGITLANLGDVIISTSTPATVTNGKWYLIK